MYGVYESDSGIPNPHASINHDYSYLEKKNYIFRPSTFSGDSIEF